ncbi:Peptidase, M23/M37 family [hydrothermal vent metagenome]|uniref:Peptidase, M23/M37 family n=1 Tax=hydrothermal vent metagenome TaxID=652676 RepID=A0A3B0R7K3_9ZZZZ
MDDRVQDRLRGWVQRVFPERQIYHRSEGEVRYISLSPRTQMLAAGGLSVFVIWILYSSASVFFNGHILSNQSLRAQETRIRSQRLLSEAKARETSARTLLASRTAGFSTAADEFEQRLGTLKLLLNHVSEPSLVTDFREPVASGNIVMAASSNDPEPRQSRPLPVEQANNQQNPPLARLVMLKKEQSIILRQAEEASVGRIENLQAVLQLTGLSADEILDSNKQNAGGPFIAMSDAEIFGEALGLDDDFSRRIIRVTSRLGEVERLEQTLDATPLGVPVLSEHRRTSKFGGRVDPITGKPARHSGQDFGAFNRAPIGATAAGTITYAGWKSGYGRFVEIDHGFGFRTRYAHMAKLTVKRGQKVSEGDKIGLMGSSGRSTGTHLHYEVWHNGKIYDPEKFLKAGLYVQKKG